MESSSYSKTHLEIAQYVVLCPQESSLINYQDFTYKLLLFFEFPS